MNIEQEKKEIEKTIQLFFDGFDNFDAELIIKAFYDDKAEMFSSGKEKASKKTVKQWRKMFEKVKNNPNDLWNREKSEKNIVYIDITGSAAQAKVEYKFSEYVYTDYYNLIKLKDQWYITNKTFDTKYFTC